MLSSKKRLPLILILFCSMFFLTDAAFAGGEDTLGDVVIAPTTPEDTTPDPVITVESDDPFGLTEILLILSLVTNGVVLAYTTFQRRGNISDTVDDLSFSSEFTQALKTVAELVPKDVAAMLYHLAIQGKGIADTAEDVFGLIANATAGEGGQTFEYEVSIPEGIPPERARQVIQDALASLEPAEA